MVLVEGVGVRIAASPAPLEVLAADEAGIDVDIGKRHGTQLFKVEV